MSSLPQDLFNRISETISADHPSFKIRYKNKSLLMRLLALLAYPFNEQFAKGYITTLGSTVYFPSQADVEDDYSGAAEVLAHEGVHIFDNDKHGIAFKVGYSLNQSALLPIAVLYMILGSWVPFAALAAGMVAAYASLYGASFVTNKRRVRMAAFLFMAAVSVVMYVGLAVWTSGWWTILAVVAFAPLLPVSSRLRAKWEYRGYAMGMAIKFWKHGYISDSYLDNMCKVFTGPDYYYMDRDVSRVMARLNAIRHDIINGSILLGEGARPYRRTLDAMKELGLVKTGVVDA